MPAILPSTFASRCRGPQQVRAVAEKYAVGTRVVGEVVNVMSYGAFVKLEPGVEGLVHVSEMSWTRRINHPSEVTQAGDKVEVVVLGINQQKREISLGMKQTQADPWDLVAEKQKALKALRETLANGLAQMPGVPLVALSALAGQGLEKLEQAVFASYERWNRRVSTGALNRWLGEALERHTAPAAKGRRIKIRFMTQPSARPPTSETRSAFTN